jgi:PAS domain S-box-containing protein
MARACPEPTGEAVTNVSPAYAYWKQRVRRQLDRAVQQKWINVGLRTKMGAMVVAGLVGLLTIFGLLGISTSRQSTQRVLNERVMLAHLGADNLDSSLLHARSILAVVANQEVLHGVPAGSDERTAALSAGFDQIAAFTQNVYLLDAGRRPVASATGVQADVDWPSVAAVRQALAGEEFGLSIVAGERPWAIVAVPVFDSHGRPTAALAALVNLADPAISPFEHPFALGETGTLDVVDADGLILISNRKERVLTVSDQAELLRELFVAGQPSVETCVGCSTASFSGDAADEVMAFAPLSQAPWALVMRQEADEVFEPVRRLTLVTFFLGVAAVLGALGLVWVTTSSVIAPMQVLRDGAVRIAQGDLTTPICCQRGDEIGDLAESFDAMRARLKSSIQEIREWNRELDARVQERTQAALAAQLEAQAARDDLRAIIDSLSDELIVVDLDRRILQLNRAAQKGAAVEGADYVGRVCSGIFHTGAYRSAERECPISMVHSTGKPVKVTHVYEQANGHHKRYLDIVASPMVDARGRVTRVIELRRDVTEEKKIEEALVRRNQQLSILNAVANTVNQSLNLEDILNRALDEVLRLTGIDAGAIFLQEERLGNLELLAHRGLSEEAAYLASRLGMLDGACGGVLELGQLVVVPDLSRYRGRRAESLKRERLSTLVHVPLMSKGCALGSMCVGTRQQHAFDPEEQELLNAIGSQIAVAIENARLYAEVQHKEQLRGELLKKVIAAQEEERKRIARELHDDTSQALTALLFAAEEGADTESLEEVQDMLQGMQDLAVRTLDGVHKLIFDLRPTMLDHLGLEPALRWFAQSRLEPAGIRVAIEEKSEPRRLPGEVETAIFRVVQEAINNVARHAAARNVCITFDFGQDGVSVDLKDDGIGFDLVELALAPDGERGLGLMGMRERAELLGGEVDISAAHGYGTHVHVHVPVPAAERTDLYA